jgi:hypothetical protein
MAAVAERSHAGILPDTPLAPDPVFVTMRTRLIAKALGESPVTVTTGEHERNVAREELLQESIRGSWITCLMRSFRQRRMEQD